VAIGKPSVLYGNVELIGATTSDAKLPILPDDVSIAINSTRLSGQPLGLVQLGASGWPPGVPVPVINVSLPTRCASLTPMMDAGEKSAGPRPNCQTILPW